LPTRANKAPEKPAKPTPSPRSPAYRCPPEAYRFKKGQSGNPSGRPKGVRTLAGELEAALKQTVSIRVGGKRRRVTKLEATMRKLADLAAAGDARMVRLLIDHLKEAEGQATPETEDVFTQADSEVIAALMARIGKKA